MAVKSVKEVVYSILEKIEDILDRITSKVDKSGDTMTGRLTINTTSNAGVYYTNTGSSSAGTDTKIQTTSWSGDSVWFGVGSGGTNRGIYDATADNWMVHRDASNNIYLGTATIGSNNAPIYLSSGVPTASSVVTGNSYNGYPMQRYNGVMFWQIDSASAYTLTNATVPSGYRPAYRYRTSCVIHYTTDNGYYHGCLQISTSGVITVYFYSVCGGLAESVTSAFYEVICFVCYKIS